MAKQIGLVALLQNPEGEASGSSGAFDVGERMAMRVAAKLHIAPRLKQSDDHPAARTAALCDLRES